MRNLFALLEHAHSNTKTFLVGIGGKVLCELLPLAVWAILFSALLGGSAWALEAMLAVAIATILCQWMLGQSAKQSFLGAYDITHQLRKTLLQDVRCQPLGNIVGKGLGERIKLMTRDLKAFEDTFSHLIADLVASLMIPIAMLSLLFFNSIYLGMTMLFVMGVAYMVLMKFERAFSQHSQQHLDQNVACTNKILEYIACLPTLKRFGRCDVLADPLHKEITALREAGLGVEWAGGVGVVLANLVLELSIPLIAAIGAYLVSLDQLSLSQWLVSVIASIACIRPFVRMTMFSTLLRYMSKSTDRLYNLSQEDQQPVNGLAPRNYDIQFKNTELSINGKSLLKDINLYVPHGQHIALVGASGAGKTTLLNLLAAFHIPTRGCIKIGGHTVEATGTAHWYNSIAYVTQDIQLFAGTLEDNLLIAKQDASRDQLQSAIKTAGLDELISRLPLGLHTEISENGGDLSGGERQRLSLARALLHDAPIILLDEFTSALDQHKQCQVLQSIQHCFASKTTITVAHRLDTVTEADCIYLLNDGAIEAFGSHSELIMESPQYQGLWEAQHNN